MGTALYWLIASLIYILMILAIVRVVRFDAGDHPHRDHLRAVSGVE